MPTYPELVDEASAQSIDKLLGLWHQLTAGTITRQEFDVTAASILETTAARTAGLADLYLAQRVTEESGVDTYPLGLPPPEQDHAGEVAAFTGTATAVGYAIGVAARNTAREAGQYVMDVGLREHGVAGWRRLPAGTGCPVCADLAQADFLPARIDMYRHRGCGCVKEPVITDPAGGTA